MMIIMDKSLDLSTRERVQHLYNKNVELENRRRRSAQAKIPSDAWQQMRENYEAIILDDHAFSEQHDIEYALWQLHYRRIEELRAHYNAALASTASATSQGGKYSSRLDRVTKIRSQFKTFLSEAAGFYHDLMQKIRAKHGLPLFYFSDVQQNQIVISGEVNKSSEIKKDLLSCHRCFIYLGDLSRYKGLYGEGDSKNSDFAAASSYYLQASTLCPSNGNPHHQLAILASYSGDELVAIYRYFRSLAVDNPFSTARDNLIIAFEKNRQSFSQLPGNHKASLVNTTPVRMTGKGCRKVAATAPLKVDKIEARVVNESASSTAETFRAFCIRFLRLNGVLFTRTSFETFEDVLSMVRDDLLELLSSGVEDMYNFGSSAADNGLVIIRLVTILIFTAHDVNKESGNQSYAEILQRSVLLQNLYTAIFEFMGHIVERCIQLHNPSASFLLSGVLVFMEWLACHPDIAAGSEVEAKQATARSHFWNNYISLLNKLISSWNIFINGDETCFFSMSKYDEGETANRLALWEDFELRGYLPLVPAQLILDFSRKQSFVGDGTDKEKKARVQRIIAAGKAVISVVQVGSEGMYFDPQLKKFAIGVLPQISNDFELDSPLEVPASNCIGQEHPVDKKTNLGLFQPKAETYIADDEEDEVIVFKPSMVDKHVDLRVELPLYDVLRPSSNNSQGDLGSHVGSVSPPLVDIFPQNAFHTNFWPHTSLATMAHQQLEAKEPSASRWMLEQQTSIANGMNNLNLMGNGLLTKPGLQDHLGLFQPAAFSGPLPPMNLVSHNEHSGLVADTVIPSKSDSILLNGGSSDILLGKSSSIFPVYSRKNPVCRPSRCCGPLPAFSTVPPKLVDDSLSGATLKNDNMQMDDFSWLDGHQLPSSTKGTGNYSVNHSAQSYHHGIPSEYLMGTVTFPFPGKQVSNLQAQFENQKSWQDYQVPNHLKLYQKQQQQQFQKINQKSIGLPKQYEGQFLWEGRFIV